MRMCALAPHTVPADGYPPRKTGELAAIVTIRMFVAILPVCSLLRVPHLVEGAISLVPFLPPVSLDICAYAACRPPPHEIPKFGFLANSDCTLPAYVEYVQFRPLNGSNDQNVSQGSLLTAQDANSPQPKAKR
jgi:hypothetical protein